MLIPIADRNGDPIPEIGNPESSFYSPSNTLLATGYTRVVVGTRGAYIEFTSENMCTENLHIPPDQKWRIHSKKAFYIEHRSRDEANVKVYEQRRTVGYADYKPALSLPSRTGVVAARTVCRSGGHVLHRTGICNYSTLKVLATILATEYEAEPTFVTTAVFTYHALDFMSGKIVDITYTTPYGNIRGALCRCFGISNLSY